MPWFVSHESFIFRLVKKPTDRESIEDRLYQKYRDGKFIQEPAEENQ